MREGSPQQVQWCTHLDLIEKKAQVFNTRLASLESVASTLSAKESDDIRAEMARMSQHIQNLNCEGSRWTWDQEQANQMRTNTTTTTH
ncbi:hypothetical protein ACQKWADRAFT_71462 [Trichoderma austrokoningii]